MLSQTSRLSRTSSKVALIALTLSLAACGQTGTSTGPGAPQGNPQAPAATIKDLAPPDVELVSDSPKVSAAGSVTLTAKTADLSGIAKVEFFQNDKKIGELTQAPYKLPLSFADSSKNGSYTFKVRVTDKAGNVNTSAPVKVVVDIPAPTTPAPKPTPTPAPRPADIVAPQVAISVDPSRITAPGTVTVTATASDNVGVTKVEFYRDGSLVATDTQAPFTYSQQFSSWRDNDRYGYLNFSAKAYDAAGNTAQSEDVSLETSIPFPPLVIPLASVEGSWRYTLTPDGGGAPVYGLVTWNGMIKAGPPTAVLIGDNAVCPAPTSAPADCEPAVGKAYLTVTTEDVTLDLDRGDTRVFSGKDADAKEDTRSGQPALEGRGTLEGGTGASFVLQKQPASASQPAQP